MWLLGTATSFLGGLRVEVLRQQRPIVRLAGSLGQPLEEVGHVGVSIVPVGLGRSHQAVDVGAKGDIIYACMVIEGDGNNIRL